MLNFSGPVVEPPFLTNRAMCVFLFPFRGEAARLSGTTDEDFAKEMEERVLAFVFFFFFRKETLGFSRLK